MQIAPEKPTVVAVAAEPRREITLRNDDLTPLLRSLRAAGARTATIGGLGQRSLSIKRPAEADDGVEEREPKRRKLDDATASGDGSQA